MHSCLTNSANDSGRDCKATLRSKHQSLTNLGLNFRYRLRLQCGDRMKDHTSAHRGVKNTIDDNAVKT